MAYKVVEINEINTGPKAAIGVKFPFNAPGVFRKSFTTDEQASTNIKSLLLTRKGERYEQPNFGTDLLNVLFEPMTDGIKEFIETTITDAVNFWLPYIKIENIDIDISGNDEITAYKVKISLNFIVTKTGSEQVITIFANEEGIIRIEEG